MTDRGPGGEWFDPMSEATQTFWTAERTAKRLGVRAVALEAKLRSHQVLAVATPSGAMGYPAFQFETVDGDTTVKPMVVVVLQIWADLDRWTVAMLFNLRATELEELTPLAWMRAGVEPEVLVRYALRIESEWKTGSDPAQRPRQRRRLLAAGDPNEFVEEVDELTETSGGVWLVTTWNSRHVLDLDEHMYAVVPAMMSLDVFDYANLLVPFSYIGRYPKVGETALIWFNDQRHPRSTQHWRMCSSIARIERLESNHPMHPANWTGR